jgi:hypothetical protein
LCLSSATADEAFVEIDKIGLAPEHAAEFEPDALDHQLTLHKRHNPEQQLLARSRIRSVRIKHACDQRTRDTKDAPFAFPELAARD